MEALAGLMLAITRRIITLLAAVSLIGLLFAMIILYHFSSADSDYLVYIKRYLWKGSALPGIQCLGYPLLGFLPYLSRSTAGFHDILDRMVLLGGKDGMAYSWAGPSLLVTLHHSGLIRQFLDHSEKITRDHRILTMFSPAGSLKRMLGSSLFFYNDEKARPISSALRSCVGHERAVAQYFELAKTIAKEHAERLVKASGTQENLIKFADDFSADLWAKAFFGVDQSHTEDPELPTLVSNLTVWATSFGHLFKHLLWSVLHRQDPSLPGLEESRAGEAFDQVVAKRVKQFASRHQLQAKESTPVLTMLLNKLSGYGTCSLKYETWETAKVAVFSGTQSAKHFIDRVLKELQHNRPVLDKLQFELTAVMPSGNIKDLTYQRFCQGTPLMDAILDETARLYAPSFALVRAVTQDISLTTTTEIPVTLAPGTIVMTTTQQMHTSEDIWGPSAKEWNPDRFIEGLSKDQKRAYMPTGYGKRSCPGSTLSMLGLKAYLILLLRNYEVDLEEVVEVPGFVSATMISNAQFCVREDSKLRLDS